MPSPDIKPYLDLTLLDKDPQDIFDAALLHLQTHLPDWVPREGNIEVLLLEALAQEVAESIFSINRLPSGITEVLLKLFGIGRDAGAAPVVHLRFTMSGAAGYTIAAGTQARLALPGGAVPMVFTTTTQLVIAPASAFGVVPATGDRFTDEANNIVAGTTLELLDSVIFVDTVTLHATITPGRKPEDDATYFSRALNRFARLQDTLVLPKHFVTFALENPVFVRAFAVDNWNGSTGNPGDHPGHITVAVYGSGALATTQQRTDLETAMSAISLANLDIHVIDPTITAINIAATVKASPGFVASALQAAVQHALQAYLNPMTWNWGGTVRRNELIALVSNVEGVDYVDTMTVPAGDTTLPGHAPLVDAATLAITVNGD